MSEDFPNIELSHICHMATVNAAIAAYNLVGRGDNNEADLQAVKAMRKYLQSQAYSGEVVIGEGERDEAPMLYIGEKVGNSKKIIYDIATDPLEGTTILANAAPGSLSVMAIAEKGSFLAAPDVYMDKIAIGPNFPKGVIDIDFSIKKNLSNLADAKNCDVKDLTVIILDRERHQDIISEVRKLGSRIQLINDGDIAAIIATTDQNQQADIYLGLGGAPEGVLAAAALATIGGQMQGRLIFKDEGQIARAKKMGVEDPNKKYNNTEMARGDIIFAATGVTDGWFLDGVKYHKNRVTTSSLLLNSKLKSKTMIKATHYI